MRMTLRSRTFAALLVATGLVAASAATTASAAESDAATDPVRQELWRLLGEGEFDEALAVVDGRLAELDEAADEALDADQHELRRARLVLLRSEALFAIGRFREEEVQSAAEAARETVERLGSAQEQVGVLHFLGHAYRVIGEYGKSRDRLERAVELAGVAYADDETKTLLLRSFLGDVLQAAGALDEAERQYLPGGRALRGRAVPALRRDRLQLRTARRLERATAIARRSCSSGPSRLPLRSLRSIRPP